MNTSEILKRTSECGDCLIWKGSFVHHVAPVISLGNQKLYVKRVLMEQAGKDIRGKCVTSSCGKSSCVNPKHLEVITKGSVIKRTASTGVFSTNAVKARVAAGKRAASKLSQEAAIEIRNSCEPMKALASRYGISETYGYMIRRGQFRRDYSSPFSGLMA